MLTHFDALFAAASTRHRIDSDERAFGAVYAEVQADGPFVPGTHVVRVVSEGGPAGAPQGVRWECRDSGWLLADGGAAGLPLAWMDAVRDALERHTHVLVRACRLQGVRRLRSAAISFDTAHGRLDVGATRMEDVDCVLRHPDRGDVRVRARRPARRGHAFAFDVYLPRPVGLDRVARALADGERHGIEADLGETVGARLADLAWLLRDAEEFALGEEAALASEILAAVAGARERSDDVRRAGFGDRLAAFAPGPLPVPLAAEPTLA